MDSELRSSATPAAANQSKSLDYARMSERPPPVDPFDRQMIRIFRYFLYLAVIVPCAAGAILVLALMLRRH